MLLCPALLLTVLLCKPICDDVIPDVEGIPIPSISVSLHWATIRAKGHVIVDGMGGIEWGRVWGVGSFGSGFSTF